MSPGVGVGVGVGVTVGVGVAVGVGLGVGVAVGVGVGMLLAPRKGSELRHEVKARSTDLAHSAADGYHRARDAAEHYCQDAYTTCRDTISRGANETRRYVRDVSDAVTMKARREGEHLGSASRSNTLGPMAS